MPEAETTFRIGQLAERAGVKISRLRYYERAGLLPKPDRDLSGHRCYTEDDLRRIGFILRAQRLGFTLRQISELLNLRVDRYNNCEDVRARIEDKTKEIEEKIQDLRRIEKALRRLSLACESRQAQGPCPILDELDPA